MHVRRDDRRGPDRGQLVAGELLGTRGICLLAGLEDRQQRCRQRVGERMRGPGQRDQGGHVDIVPACVHHAPTGAEGSVRALLHGQAVELRPHGHRRTGGRTHAGSEARVSDGVARHGKLLRDGGGRLLLMVCQLRPGVKPVAQQHGVGQLALHAGEKLREQLVSRRRHSACTPRRGRAPRPPRARRA